MAHNFVSTLRRALLPLAIAASLAPVSASATVVTYGFTNISSNLSGDAEIGEAQLFVDVTDVGVLSTQTAFIFRNTGPLASSITDIYFDDGALLGIASIINGGTGVDFTQNATPGDLPSGNSADPDFVATAGFTADSTAPVQPNGVNPYESVTIVFNLINGMDFDDVLAALAAPFTTDSTSPWLRIGIHVQGFASGGSESFINDEPPPPPPPPTGIPEPAPLALLGLGLTGLWAIRRRKQS